MAISWNVTQVCWIKSPEVKPVTKDERIRLGLLIKKRFDPPSRRDFPEQQKTPDDNKADDRDSETVHGKHTPALHHGGIGCCASS